MSGKLVLASEKIPEKKVTKVAKEKYSYSFGMKNDLTKLGIGTPTSKWQIMPLQDSNLQSNTWYWSPEPREVPVSLHIIDKIDIRFDESLPNVFKNMVDHIDAEFKGFDQPIYEIGNITTIDGHQAIGIVINEKRAIGYYLLDLNTFIFGNIGWHEHYSKIVIPAIWPQILEKLNLT